MLCSQELHLGVLSLGSGELASFPGEWGRGVVAGMAPGQQTLVPLAPLLKPVEDSWLRELGAYVAGKRYHSQAQDQNPGSPQCLHSQSRADENSSCELCY